MEKKNFIIVALCVAIGIMAVAYAAFSTTLTVNGTLTQIGTFGVKLLAEEASVTGTAGFTGGTAPTATCTSTTGSATGTMTATLRQPGDKVICTYTVQNIGNLKAKSSGDETCTASSGMNNGQSSGSTGSKSTPMYYKVNWGRTALTKSGTTGARVDEEITIEIGYWSNVTTQPSVTTATVSCDFPYTQDI